MDRLRVMGWTGAVVALLMLTGCPKPPEDAMSDATEAVEKAKAKSECAEEEFAAAQRLLEEAKKLSKQKKYDEARRKAEAAERLAKKARKKAELNWEDCQKRLNKDEKVVEKDEDTEEDIRQQPQQREESAKLRTIHFGYDSAELSSEARDRLEENVRWMEQHPDREVVLEGHTDKRGSIQYNLALGEQRARTVKEYVVQLGISENRLSILSYGEEKPIAYGDTAADYRKNRRVEFVPK